MSCCSQLKESFDYRSRKKPILRKYDNFFSHSRQRLRPPRVANRALVPGVWRDGAHSLRWQRHRHLDRHESEEDEDGHEYIHR